MARDAQAALAAMVAAAISECPDLEKVGAVEVIDVVVRDASGNVKQLEALVTEAGGIGPEVASSFMTIAAMAAILRAFPAEDDRRKLAAAGEVVGNTIAAQWRDKIKTTIVSKMRSN